MIGISRHATEPTMLDSVSVTSTTPDSRVNYCKLVHDTTTFILKGWSVIWYQSNQFLFNFFMCSSSIKYFKSFDSTNWTPFDSPFFEELCRASYANQKWYHSPKGKVHWPGRMDLEHIQLHPFCCFYWWSKWVWKHIMTAMKKNNLRPVENRRQSHTYQTDCRGCQQKHFLLIDWHQRWKCCEFYNSDRVAKQWNEGKPSDSNSKLIIQTSLSVVVEPPFWIISEIKSIFP